MASGNRTLRINDATWYWIKRQAKKENISAAELMLNAVAAKYPDLPMLQVGRGQAVEIPEGWQQCGNPGCEGWNVGTLDGVKRCADCGWSEEIR